MTYPAESLFDPNRHLRRLPNGDYLEVKWRLVWLRSQHPEAVIETELVSLTDDHALFRARVSIPNAGSASGFGSENAADFRDFIEKAETKALGRALAALGFGTQFCTDFDLNGKVADAPIAGSADRAASRSRQSGDRSPADLQRLTARQFGYLQAIAREIGLSESDLDSESNRRFGLSPNDLTRRDASSWIDDLRARRTATPDALAS